jgi:hypothetical protein
MALRVALDILNQKGTPAFYSDTFANRPAFGFAGRVFISTDTGAIYEDTGTAWTLIADAGAGTTGTLQQVTTNGNTTTNSIIVKGITINSSTGTTTNNIGIGNTNLSSNTTGIGNTSIGFSSLLANTTGYSNTAIGYKSLLANIIGVNNTSVGESSLLKLLSGDNNTGIGDLALGELTTGSYNIGVGKNAGQSITTGQYNTIIGSNISTGITTGSYNTILGSFISGLSATLSNNVILADGQGNVRLFSDANGLIAINQTVGSVPGGQVDIHTSQTYGLVLNGLTTNNAYQAFSNNNVGKWRIGNTYNAGANTFDIYDLTNSITRVSVTNAGNVGIATTVNPVYPLDVNGAARANDIIAGGSTYSYDGTLRTRNASNVNTNLFNANGLSYITGGNFSIGSIVDTGEKLQITGNTLMLLTRSGINSRQIYFGGAGDLVFYNSSNNASLSTAGAWVNASDISIKKDIVNIKYGLNDLLKLCPRSYKMKSNDKDEIGFIAQEVLPVIPELVHDTTDTGVLSLNYGNMNALIVKSIIEINNKLERNNIN